MIQESIHQENQTIINVKLSNDRASEHMHQKLLILNGKIPKFTIIVDFNIPL